MDPPPLHLPPLDYVALFGTGPVGEMYDDRKRLRGALKIIRRSHSAVFIDDASTTADVAAAIRLAKKWKLR